MHIITEVLEKIYENSKLRNTIIPLFISPPGLGKTSLIKKFAESKKAKLITFITSTRNPMEISGIAMPDQTLKKMSYWDFDVLAEAKDGDILFFDELFNGASTAVLNACLTLFEERTMISGKKLANVMIVAASNPKGMTPLTDQIKERFVWYDLNFKTHFKESWIKEVLFKDYFVTKEIANNLVSLVEAETFKDRNFYTPRSIEKALNMIIYECPTPYETVLMPILSKSVTNTGGTINLTDNKKWLPNEQLKWIDAIREMIKINTIKHLENDKIIK